MGVVWAELFLALLAVVKTVPHARGSFDLADTLFDPSAFGTSPAHVIGSASFSAAAVGALMGLVGRRISAAALVRCAALLAASVPALYLVAAVALMLIWGPQAARESGTGALLLFPVVGLLYAAPAMVFLGPAALGPAALAAIMVEGWTRPETQRQSGPADPRFRRWAVFLVVIAAAVLTAVAVLRWRAG